MVKGALFKKSIQDIKKNRSQFVSIFILAMVAVCMAAGLDSIWKTLDTQSETMYGQTHLSDLWVTVPNPSEMSLWRVRNVPGVEKAEKRFLVNATAQIAGKPTLQVYAVPSESTLDQPDVLAGEKLSKRGAILDRSFAQANNLHVGDNLTVEINKKKIHINIEALALSSEHIYAVRDASSLKPDPKAYGFLVMDEDRAASAYGGIKPYNQIELRLAPGADENAVAKQMDSIFGRKLGNVLSREDGRSTNIVSSKIVQFRTLATIFPIMFFVVTALITFSTMVRLTEDQRGQIGILKALGYGRRSILWHYTSYGVFVGLLGILAGALIGPNLLGKTLLAKFESLLTFPHRELDLNYPGLALCALVILLCTGGISCYSCLKLQRESPANLLRNKPPKKGSHILLERLPLLWDRMKFSQKLIARNAARNKLRISMSILGVAGCAGLIIGTFTLFDMITGITDTVYGKVYSYDEKIVLDDSATDQDIRSLHLNGTVQEMLEGSVQLTTPEGLRKVTAVTVFSKDSPLVHLQDAEGEPVTLPESGVAITRKLAETMRVKVGDTLMLKRSNDSYCPVRIMKTVYMVTGQGIYMTDDSWRAMGEDYKPTSVLVKWNKKDNSFLSSDYVKNYMDRIQQKSDFEENVTAVYSAAMMLITAGAILAFVVLYNMGMLNFAERVRDLATLEVLGFRQKEIRALVLADNIFSAAVGILCGIPVGKGITEVIAGGFGDSFDLIGRVTSDKVLIAAVMTLLFTAIINHIVTKKIKGIDMLQALKSVE